MTEALSLNSFSSIDSLISYEKHYTILMDSVATGTTEYIDECAILAGKPYHYWLQAVSLTGESEKVHANRQMVTVSERIPDTFSLCVPYPNPFNAVTTISYSIPEQCPVRLEIYTIGGQLAHLALDETQVAGSYSVTWDADGYPSGLFLCVLKAGKRTATRKMLLLK